MTQTVILSSHDRRKEAKSIIDAAPPNSVVKISAPKRTLEQNDALWALLSDISRAKPEGREWPPETWKAAIMHALGHEMRFEHGLEGKGAFPLGYSSSRLTKDQMSELLEYAMAYAARHGVAIGPVSSGPGPSGSSPPGTADGRDAGSPATPLREPASNLLDNFKADLRGKLKLARNKAEALGLIDKAWLLWRDGLNDAGLEQDASKIVELAKQHAEGMRI